jgi:hypothetical protein
MTQSERIASSTHFGIGALPVSQRATVERLTPNASERPDCVSPASFRRAISVSGRKASMIFSSAGALAVTAASVDAGACAANFGAEDAGHLAKDRAVWAGGLERVAGGGGGFERVPGRLAGEAGDERVCGFHVSNVAPCHNTVNNLYRTSLGSNQ